MTLIYILLSIIINAVIGAAVCAALDTKDQTFYNWYKRDPTKGLMSFIVLSLWPIMAYFMIKYKNKQNKTKSI